MSERTLTLPSNAVTAVLLVAVMLCGTVAAAAPAAASSGIDAQQIDADDTEPADEIYVDGDGDAVLVYEDEDGDDELTTFDLGMHVSEGLAHTLIVAEPDEELDESAAGGFSMVLEEDRFFSEGDLQMDSPEELEDLNIDIQGEQSSETSEFDANLEMIFEGEDGTDDFESLETTGDAEVTPDTFATSGDVNAELGTVQGGEFYYDVSVTDTGDGYTLDVTQDEIVSQFQAGMWETEDAAEQTLEGQYGMIAEEFGGTTEITIESYSYTETADGEGDLDISYTVEFQNVQDGFADVFAQVLAEDPELDLSQSEADALAESLVDVEIDTMEFTAEQSGSTLNADWTIELSNLEGAVDEMITLVDTIDAPELDDELDEFQDTVEAQQEADLEQYYEWSATFEQYDADHDRIDLSLSTDTENWSEYIDELEARGIEGTTGDLTFDLTAEIDDNDVLVADMALEVEQEELVEQALDSMIEAAMDDPTTGPELNEFLTDLDDSEFEIAAMDATIDGETVEIEAGAQFGNMEALSDEINEAFGGHEVTEIAGALEDDTMGVHVHVDALVDADADEGDVRALAVADDDTEIYLDGDWDRDFNEMDIAAAEEFLGTQSEAGMDDEADDDDDSLPGFGPLVALVSLIAVALFARNRT